jgi:hypothetical protein
VKNNIAEECWTVDERTQGRESWNLSFILCASGTVGGCSRKAAAMVWGGSRTSSPNTSKEHRLDPQDSHRSDKNRVHYNRISNEIPIPYPSNMLNSSNALRCVDHGIIVN